MREATHWQITDACCGDATRGTQELLNGLLPPKRFWGCPTHMVPPLLKSKMRTQRGVPRGGPWPWLVLLSVASLICSSPAFAPPWRRSCALLGLFGLGTSLGLCPPAEAQDLPAPPDVAAVPADAEVTPSGLAFKVLRAPNCASSTAPEACEDERPLKFDKAPLRKRGKKQRTEAAQTDTFPPRC